ncbi:galactosyltransferase-related protein [Echinicola strongylocentroti]|nr:galactosyltransferase-related protein [Echinicola strongylocentroti]
MSTFKKTPLKDVSFLIPVRIDHTDRLTNLEVIIAYLSKYFDTSVWIWENDVEPKVPDWIRKTTNYHFEPSKGDLFRRTRINNRLIKACDTPIAVLYDTDVIIPPQQLIASVEMIRQHRAGFALPYDGRFVQVDRYHRKLFSRLLEPRMLTDSLTAFAVDTYLSVGGCFVFDREVYRRCGMENEGIEGWGHDDAERVKRLEKLGYSIFRPEGPLFHLWHERTVNSWFYDEVRAIRSCRAYLETCKADRGALERSISLWRWRGE